MRLRKGEVAGLDFLAKIKSENSELENSPGTDEAGLAQIVGYLINGLTRSDDEFNTAGVGGINGLGVETKGHGGDDREDEKNGSEVAAHS